MRIPLAEPFTNDAVLKPTTEGLVFSSPDFVKGLRIYADYTITVRIFASRNAADPIDMLKQKIRCYVDTRGPTLKLFESLKKAIGLSIWQFRVSLGLP
jgi:hypothetical protein